MTHKCKLRKDSSSHLPKVLPDAPWHSRIKRRLQKLLLVSIHHPEVFKVFFSEAAVEKESKRQVKHFPGFTIHPLSEFRKYWNLFMVFVMLFHQMISPMAIGFLLDMSDSTVNVFIVLDLFACCFLAIEVVLTFRTGCIIRQTNEIILNSKDIAKSYSKFLLPDVIGCIPFILLGTKIVEENHSTINGKLLIYMCCLFGFSFYRFSRILDYCSSIPIILDLSEKGAIIFALCLRSIYCWHWASCVRRLMPLYLESNPLMRNVWKEESALNSKLHLNPTDLVHELDFADVENLILEDLKEVFGNYTMLNLYTHTLMVTLKMVLQSGYDTEASDSVYSMLMSTVLMFGGWIYATYVMILISNVMMASANSENKFEEVSREIDAFCRAKGLSRKLTGKIKTLYDYKFNKHYFNETAIERSTPASLRKEIMMHSCAHLVANVPIFKGVPRNLVESIITCLKREIFYPDDVIIHAGASGGEMFFLAFGTAAVYSASGNCMGTLVDGSHFGEISLLIRGQKRIASIVAIEICEVYKLGQRDFRKVIEPHAEILNQMEHIALERIKIMSDQEKSNR